jgi:hypothetical protein
LDPILWDTVEVPKYEISPTDFSIYWFLQSDLFSTGMRFNYLYGQTDQAGFPDPGEVDHRG